MPAAMDVPKNLFDAAAQAAERHGDRDFLIMGRREAVLSFADLARRADAFGRTLARLGVKPGDRVAMWMTNSVEFAVAAYGIARCGAVMVGVSTRLSVREVTHMLSLTRATAWIMEDIFLGKIDAFASVTPVLSALDQQGLPRPIVLMLSAAGQTYPDALSWTEELAKPSPSLASAADLIAKGAQSDYPEIADVAAILSTSGTTGSPKGVMLTHEGLIKLAFAVGQRQGLDPTQRFYSMAPFFHCSGYMHGLLTNLLAGSTFYGTRQQNLSEAWDVITGEKVTVQHGFIELIQGLAERPGAKAALTSFRAAWYSAAASEMARLEDVLGVRQCEVYGLTETGGNVSICTSDDPVEMRHDSDGRPQDGVDVKIIDPVTGVEQGQDQPGEILVRGYNVMKGYFRDAEATKKTLRDGWLHTGDRGVLLAGGYIKFLSRLKDVIRVGGENVSPMEVEEVLLGHPSIQEVAVVSGPDPRLTEVPVAFVIASPGASLDEAEVRKFCRERLANFKVPTRVICLDDFPRTGATNRIQKSQLREMLLAMNPS